MSRINGIPSSFRDRKTILLNDELDTVDLSLVHITTAPNLTTPFASSLITEPGRLRYFACDTVTDVTGDGITRTTFYDTSGSPSGTESVLYSFLSFSSQTASSTSSIQDHTANFPGNGLYYKNGVGVRCQRISGTPDITAVDAKLYYQPLLS